VHRPSSGGSHAGSSVAEDALFRGHFVGRIADPKDPLDSTISPGQDAAHFIGFARSGVIEQLLA
jgi:hypothetical protein